MSRSLFSYNETLAQLYFPLAKEDALNKGLRWKDPVEQRSDAAISVALPDSILDIDDSLSRQILICHASGRPYKLIPQELKLYRALKLPIPRLSPMERQKLRMERRNSLSLVT